MFEVGDLIKVSGAGEAANNTYYIVTAVDVGGADLTVDDVWNDIGATEAAGESVTVLCSELKIGSTRKSFTIEKWFADISKGFNFKGCIIGGMNLSLNTNVIITGSFDVNGKSQVPSTAALGSPSAVATTDPFEGSEADMIVKEGGSAIADITTLTVNITANLGSTFTLGANEKADIPAGRCRVTGQLSALFADLTLVNKWLNKTPSDFDLVLPSAMKENGCYRVPGTGDPVFRIHAENRERKRGCGKHALGGLLRCRHAESADYSAVAGENKKILGKTFLKRFLGEPFFKKIPPWRDLTPLPKNFKRWGWGWVINSSRGQVGPGRAWRMGSLAPRMETATKCNFVARTEG